MRRAPADVAPGGDDPGFIIGAAYDRGGDRAGNNRAIAVPESCIDVDRPAMLLDRLQDIVPVAEIGIQRVHRGTDKVLPFALPFRQRRDLGAYFKNVSVQARLDIDVLQAIEYAPVPG